MAAPYSELTRQARSSSDLARVHLQKQMGDVASEDDACIYTRAKNALSAGNIRCIHTEL